MIYSGNHLFHYTNFESALKIIVTSSLKFGKFDNMNDIAEIKREVISMLDENTINKILSQYQSISLTLDDPSMRGYSIDPLWGHYAQKGNGVCLVFDKELLFSDLRKQFGNRVKIAPINYQYGYSSIVFPNGNTEKEVKNYFSNNEEGIFFTKSSDWKYENELRILIKNKNETSFIFEDKALITAILCLPKIGNYKESPEFLILKKIMSNKPILRYTTSFGNRELVNENDEKMCDIIGLDCQLAL